MNARLLTCAATVALSLTLHAGQAPTLRITSPPPDAIVSGPTLIRASLEPQVAVESVSISVNGQQLCTLRRPPFQCEWDPGAAPREHHVRVVAKLASGSSVVANVRTKELPPHTERSGVEAVLVPTIVTDRGRFVRGLTRQDFQVFENGAPQTIASLVAEESPLDLVMAIDVSGSMESALDEVKAAVKQFLGKLRPGDAATLVGFNDNMFIAAERETDPAIRDAAVDLLASWGGTAIYDTTVRVLDMVGQPGSRRGVVLFSDGDDRHSMTTREAAMARVQSSDAMLYTIGFGTAVTSQTLKSSLEDYARATGGRAFFPRNSRELDAVFDEIVTELANQYVLSYSPPDLRPDGRWREITVKVRSGNYNVRARRGYRPQGPGGRGGA